MTARSHIFGSQAAQSVKHFWDLGKGKTRSVAAGVAYGFPATSPRLTQEKTPVVVKLLIVLIIRLVLLLCSCVWSCVPQCASSFAPRTHVDKRDGNRNRLCGFHQRYARTRIGHGSLLKSSIIKVRTSREAKRWTPLYIYTPYGNAFYGPSPPHPQVVVVVLVVRVRLIVLRRSTSSRLCMGGGAPGISSGLGGPGMRASTTKILPLSHSAGHGLQRGTWRPKVRPYLPRSGNSLKLCLTLKLPCRSSMQLGLAVFRSCEVALLRRTVVILLNSNQIALHFL